MLFFCKMELKYVIIALVIICLAGVLYWKRKSVSGFSEKKGNYTMSAFSTPDSEFTHRFPYDGEDKDSDDEGLDINSVCERVIKKASKRDKEVPTHSELVRYVFHKPLISTSVNFKSKNKEMEMKIYEDLKLLAEMKRDGQDLVVRLKNDQNKNEEKRFNTVFLCAESSLYRLDMSQTTIRFNHVTIADYSQPRNISSFLIRSSQISNMFVNKLSFEGEE